MANLDLLIFFNAVTLLVGRQEGIWSVKKCWVWFIGGDYLTGALHVL